MHRYAPGGPSAPLDDASNRQKEKEKLNSIIQHFFTKAALTIIESRVNLPQSFSRETGQPRSNKWFHLTLNDSDVFAGDLDEWATLDVSEGQPASLVIETYLDIGELRGTQTLVIVDERGRKWDVAEALAATKQASMDRDRRGRDSTIVLERWRLHLDTQENNGSDEPISNAYKKALLLFRALYTYLRFLPAWQFGRNLAKQPATLNTLRPMYRILREGSSARTKDSGHVGLYPSREPTSEVYKFTPIHTPAGPMCIEVSYRVNCDFRVDESEALLSSRFIGMDDQYFTPSLGDKSGANIPYRPMPKEVGSLPVDRRHLAVSAERNQVYGSLSTFHHAGAQTGTSPISALRAARERNRGLDSPDSYPSKIPPSPLGPNASRSSLRSADAGSTSSRRVSVSFMPFKAGSLSSSPGPGINPGPSFRASSLTSGLVHAASERLPSPSHMQSPKASPILEVAIELPGSSSPKAPPMTRYSSSFGNRKSRFSSSAGGSGSKLDDDSSGKTSLTSSNQPDSSVLAEGEGGRSPYDDDGHVSNLLGQLEGNVNLDKDLKHSEPEPRSATPQDHDSESRMRRGLSTMGRLRVRRDSQSSVDSLASSLPQRSPRSFSSRNMSLLSNATPGLAGNSVSTSSTSPGKPMSPHTPHSHMPAIPSRLSANAIIAPASSDLPEPISAARRSRHQDRRRSSTSAEQRQEHEQQRQLPPNASTAIDIPTSPNRYIRSHVRRTSSARSRRRVEVEEEFGLRSASMPHGGDASNNSFSDVFALQGVSPAGDNARKPPDTPPSVPAPAAAVMEDEDDITALQDTPTTQSSSPFTARPSSTLLRPRSHRGGSGSIRGSSSSSFGGNSGGSGGSSERVERGSGAAASGGRYSSRAGPMAALVGLDDDEPLLFTMSELGAQQQSQSQSQSLGSGSGSSSNRNANSSSAHGRRSAAGGSGVTRR